MHEGWFVEDTTHGPVTVDTFDDSRPHEGKVLCIVQAHADDMPLCSGGLVAKLVAEGYKAFLVNMTNDEKCGPGTIADAIKSNEVDVDNLAACLGIEEVFNLGYRNHRQDENAMIEQRCRLIFLFRHLQVDTVMSFHPWAKWEENPDHYVTGYAVESACWIAGAAKSFPEQIQAGMKPKAVQDKYYWAMRPGSPYNHVTDISPFLDKKIESMATNIRLFGLETEKRMGEPYGLEYAEYHYYFPARGTFPWEDTAGRIDAYVKQHAVKA
jgi:LmbE family N-acetylglucosaminyl deacetylase